MDFDHQGATVLASMTTSRRLTNVYDASAGMSTLAVALFATVLIMTIMVGFDLYDFCKECECAAAFTKLGHARPRTLAIR